MWNWAANRSKLKQASLRQKQARVELTFERRQLLASLHMFYEEAQTSRLEQDSLSQSAELTAQSLRLTTLRCQAGEATVLKVVDAQNTATLARSAFSDGQSRLRVALANLQTLTGSFCMKRANHTRLAEAEFHRCSRGGFTARLKAGIIFFTMVLLLLLLSCAKDSGEKEPAVPVPVVSVEKKTIQSTVTAEAVLFPFQQAAITPKISAPVKTFYIRRGSKVRKGQLLAILENRDLAAAAQENKGAYSQAEAAYETTAASDLPQEVQKAQLDLQSAKELFAAQQKIYDSRQDLYQQGAMPRKELDQARVDLTNARNQYEIAQKHLDALLAIGKQQQLKSAAGQLQSAQGKYLGATAQLSYSQIHSPIDGVVADRPLYPGEMAAAGTPLLTVMDISQVIARAHIPQPEAALLKVGDKATVTVRGQDNPMEGQISVVSPALDPNSTTVEVWVQVRNPDQLLKPGTSVQLAMLAQTIPDALVIPAVGLLTAPDGSMSVMQISADDHAHQKKVRVGIRQDATVQIVEGLQAGDRIVASGAYGLPDNSKIKVENQNEK